MKAIFAISNDIKDVRKHVIDFIENLDPSIVYLIENSKRSHYVKNILLDFSIACRIETKSKRFSFLEAVELSKKVDEAFLVWSGKRDNLVILSDALYKEKKKKHLKIEAFNPFDLDFDLLCLNTHGVTGKRGAVLGDGVSLFARMIYPDIVKELGDLIKNKGHKFHILSHSLASFPDRPIETINYGHNVVDYAVDLVSLGKKIAGFYSQVDFDILEKSCEELLEYIEKNQLKKVYVPFPVAEGVKAERVVELFKRTGLEDRAYIFDLEAVLSKPRLRKEKNRSIKR